MPIVTITTNVASSCIPDTFQASITSLMVEALKKPREVLYVDLKADSNVMMGGNRNPCVHASVECIGRLNPTSNLAMARSLEDAFMKNLGVKRDRIVIRFIPVRAEFCSYNGALHDVDIDTDQDLLPKE